MQHAHGIGYVRRAPGVLQLATLLLVFAACVACATSATGRKQLLLLPEDEMRGMGQKAFLDLKGESPALKEPTTNAYVQCVVSALLSAIGARASEWEVVVFEDAAVNAFALPGGKIGVYTGLLEVADDQNQLAAVIGHEIAHVTQRHGNERVSQSFVAEGGLAVASAALGGEGKEHDLAMAALGVGAQYGVLMPFGRTQESEADAIGLDYMANAGFDPQGAVTLWKNMAAATGKGPPEFLSTHPSHDTRIADIQRRLPSAAALSQGAHAKGAIPRCVSPAASVARAD